MAIFGESWDDPQTALMLALSAGLLSGKGNTASRFGQGLLGGMGAYQDARKMQMLGQQQEMQRRLMQSQMDENAAQAAARKAAMERQANIDKAFAGVIQQPYMGAEQGPPIPPELARPVLDRGKYEAAMAQYFPEDYIDYLEKQKPAKPTNVPSPVKIIDEIYPPGHPLRAKALRDLATKTTTHPPVFGQTAYVPPGQDEPVVAPFDTRSGNVGKPYGGRPPTGRGQNAVQRPLPNAAVNDLTKKAEVVQEMTSLMSSFKDNFAGDVVDVYGRALNFGSRNLPFTDEARGLWWQRMDSLDNEVRHGLFGTALSANEKALWERSTVSPGMKPESLKANLQVRSEILSSAMKRLAKTWSANGYSADAIEAATGVEVERPSAASGQTRSPGVKPRKPISEMTTEELEARQRELRGEK